MQLPSLNCVVQRKRALQTPPESILTTIGWSGLLRLVWCSTPVVLRLVALPYGLLVYRELLAASHCRQGLYIQHAQKYQSSFVFRVFRPRYHKVHSMLESVSTASATCAPNSPRLIPLLGALKTDTPRAVLRRPRALMQV